MASIRVKLKDGTVREFPHVQRAGGSYANKVTYEHGWVVVEDAWHERTAFPADTVAEVVETPARY